MGGTRRPSGGSLCDYVARAVIARTFAITGADALALAAGAPAAAVRRRIVPMCRSPWLKPAAMVLDQANELSAATDSEFPRSFPTEER